MSKSIWSRTQRHPFWRRRRVSGRPKRPQGKIKRLVLPILANYNALHGPLFAKGLGFSFVFGGVPLLFLALSVGVHFFRVSPGLQTTISELLIGFLPEQAKADILEQVLSLTANPGSLGIVVIGVFVVTSFALFDSLERTITTMLNAPRRRFFLGRSISLVLMGTAMVLFYITAGLSTTAHYFSKSMKIPPILVYSTAKIGSILLVACVFLFLYRLFARRRLRFGPTLGVAFAGAFVWGVVGMIGAKIVQLAIRRFIIYGALAWAVLFLMYMRILGEIIVFTSILVGRISPTQRSKAVSSV